MPPANSQNPPIDWNIISSVSFLNRERSEKLKKCEQDGCKKAFAEAKRSKWEDGVFGKFGKRGTYARRTSTAQELSPDDPLLGLRDSSGISTTAFRSDAAHLRGLLAPRTADGEDMCVETGREIKASAGFFLHKFQYNKVAETPASMRHKKLLGAVDQFKNFKVSLDGDLRERDPAVWAAKKVAKHLLHKSALLSSRASRVPSQILMADAQWLARKFGWRSPDGSKKISTLRAPTPRRNRSSRNNTNN